jgi:predicted amidohydrolase/dienelactone hydrolase
MYSFLRSLLVAGSCSFVAALPASGPEYQTPGVVRDLPVFAPALAARIEHPLAWKNSGGADFDAWRETAREKVRSRLLARPPEAPWEAHVIAEDDRGDYVARKLVFNLTGDSRVLAYLTVPKGRGPFPAVLLLHDHGAKFDIGKEKVIRPWDIAAEKQDSAIKWVEQNYGGRFLGDELARRGYVCFATDALNWSDRGGGGFDGQQKLASNLMHLGMSLAGLMAWEDLRAAEFLSQQPEVEAGRVVAMGWSMGAFRAWQVAALSDQVAGAVSICWMSTARHLMMPGNNQTRGSSAFNMLHPGLLDALDFPDIASLACPKPMLFFNGRQDRLFPTEGVEAAFARLRDVWVSQRVGDRLVTKLWDAPHIFDAEMQDEAFRWMDRMFAPAPASIPPPPGQTTAGPYRKMPPSPTHVRVAVAQFRSSTDLADNVARMKVQIAAAASRGAQVIVFPECAISSYFQEAITKLTEAELLAAEREVLAACREHRIEAIIGTPYFRDGQLYNGALIVNAEGDVIARHDKVHLVGGDTAWNCAPGSQPPPVFRLGGAWSSVVICHDSRYPELTRLPVLAGARVIYYISHEASVARETKLIPYRAQVQARAVENGVFVVHANAPADDVRRGSHGQSRIVAPDGNLISEASIFEDELLLADLELAQANAENGLRSLERSPLSDWWREGLQQVRVIE